MGRGLLGTSMACCFVAGVRGYVVLDGVRSHAQEQDWIRRRFHVDFFCVLCVLVESFFSFGSYRLCCHDLRSALYIVSSLLPLVTRGITASLSFPSCP